MFTIKKTSWFLVIVYVISQITLTFKTTKNYGMIIEVNLVIPNKQQSPY